MLTKIPTNIQFFEMSYGDEFPADQYYVISFESISSKLETNEYYDQPVLEYFFQNGFTIVSKYDIERKSTRHNVTESILVNYDKNIIVIADYYIGNTKFDGLMTLKYLYNINKGEIKTQLDFDQINKFKQIKKKSNINLVISNHGSLDTEEYDIAVPEIDLVLNYGENFPIIHEKIIKRLNTDKDKGIILLHGDAGTGKTSYLKYLTKFMKKDLLFIPPSMAEMLSEPTIIPFLMDKTNSILIIEDAEKVITERETNGSAPGVSNLLNLTDGILGDCLNIQVIATFNMKRERIDRALLRKGRLIAEHMFDKLSIESTNKLLKYLNKDYVSNVGLTLADIYNIDEDEMRVTKDVAKIGFR